MAKPPWWQNRLLRASAAGAQVGDVAERESELGRGHGLEWKQESWSGLATWAWPTLVS